MKIIITTLLLGLFSFFLISCANSKKKDYSMGKDGLIYKGTLIEDAGEVYKLFTQYLNDYSMR